MSLDVTYSCTMAKFEVHSPAVLLQSAPGGSPLLRWLVARHLRTAYAARVSKGQKSSQLGVCNRKCSGVPTAWRCAARHTLRMHTKHALSHLQAWCSGPSWRSREASRSNWQRATACVGTRAPLAGVEIAEIVRHPVCGQFAALVWLDFAVGQHSSRKAKLSC